MRGLLVLIAAVGCSGILTAQQHEVDNRPVQVERSHDFDVLHYKVQLELAQKTRSYAGSAVITLRSLRAGFDACTLDAETFVVTGAHRRPGEPLRFKQDSGHVTVFFDTPFGYDDTLSFIISYVADNVDVDEVTYGMGAGYDLGLSFKPATEHRSAIINTLSFPTGARHWFPCYDHPNDKASTEVIVTVDETFSVLSNGELLSERHDAQKQTRTFHWYQERPHATYLTVMVAGEYAVVRDSLGEIPVSYWVYPSDEPHARRTFGMTPDVLRFFGDLFGVPYPWVKYDQITIPGIGGGAESTTATVIGESAVIDAAGELDFPSAWLVAHEGAHQWWGDYVTMRDWSHTWMNESFATFYEYIWSRHLYGDDEGAWNLENKRRQYYREADTRYRRPIVYDRWVYPNQNFDSHTYPKGAAVLHMLREELGHEEFDASIRHFLRSHPYASVDTRDLLVAIREATGRVMDPFFDQWIYAAGHPELDVQWTWNAGSKEIVVHVRQTQKLTDRVPVFSFPLEIGIQSGLGYMVEKVFVRDTSHVFRIRSEQRPEFVRFDEGNTLLARITVRGTVEEDMIKARATDVVGRRKAIERLGTSLDREDVVAVLQEVGARDDFWRVRGTAVRTLGEGQKGAEAFFRERYTDQSSGVRAAAVFGLGRVGSAGTVPFLKTIFQEDSSYLVRSEAVRAIGRLGGANERPFLEAARSIPSQRSVIQRAAEEALTFIENEQSY